MPIETPCAMPAAFITSDTRCALPLGASPLHPHPTNLAFLLLFLSCILPISPSLFSLLFSSLLLPYHPSLLYTFISSLPVFSLLLPSLSSISHFLPPPLQPSASPMARGSLSLSIA